MSKPEKNKSITALIEELEELVAWFDTDDFSLEEALIKYKKAEELAHVIEEQLDHMKNEIVTIKQRFDS